MVTILLNDQCDASFFLFFFLAGVFINSWTKNTLAWFKILKDCISNFVKILHVSEGIGDSQALNTY